MFSISVFYRYFKMTPWLVVIFGLVTAGNLTDTDQLTSESNHHDQVAILKQIRKINDDGSYTFGYEAGDGSFKVETRDVLGNVKGTFGFVDANGEIKRVTYSSSNGTGFKATTISPSQERASVIQSIPSRTNRSSIASILKKSNSMAFSTSTESSSPTTPTTPKLNIVQSITSRNSLKNGGITSTTSTTTERPPKIFGHYLKTSKNRTRAFVHDEEPRTSEDESTDRFSTNSHQSHSTAEIKPKGHKDYLTKIPFDDILLPVIENIDERKEKTRSNSGGNNFRRQIDEKTTIKVRESQEETGSSEHSDVYDGRSLSTTRPLFTTTTSPSTIKPKIIRSRTESSKLHYQPKIKIPQSTTEENLAAAKFDNVKYENPKMFTAEKYVDESPEITENYYIRDFIPMMPHQSRIPAGDYMVKDVVEPIHIRHRQVDRNGKDLPLGVILANPSSAEEDTNGVIPLGRRILLRIRSPNKPINYQSAEERDSDYVAEAAPNVIPIKSVVPLTASTSNIATTVNPNYIIRKQYVQDGEQEPQSPIDLRLIQQQQLHQQQQQQLHPQSSRDRDYLRDYFYRNIVLPPELPNPITPPLSRRDFQILLRRLLASQYGIRAFNHPRSYLNDALGDEPISPNYYAPPPRYAFVYPEPQAAPIPIAVANRYNKRITIAEPDAPKMMANGYSAPIEAAYSRNLHYQDPRYNRRVNRIRYYNNNDDMDGESSATYNDDEILPPPIREALLLRMLQLAINSNQQPMAQSIPISASNIEPNMQNSAMPEVNPMPIYRKSGPTRSVQILTNDKSEENDSMRIKS